MKRVFLLCSLAALSACSSLPGQSDAERLAMFRKNAGAPVRDFRLFGSLNGWQPLGNSALAVWTRPNEAYLLDLTGPCPDLDYAPAISISSMMNQVSTFDRVMPVGGGAAGMRIPCHIRTIRPLDVKALKAAQAELRKAEVVAREAEAKDRP
ncbi:DUF6491 family protein [Pseudoxanthomonas mexicana]|uniref:DUF6491 family protein n=1 Tax=Pseudoxanthomonas mexicana TaxID=128785 RepID=UPI00398A7A65